MFDFRYHIASLAAVFLALVLGILIGVAISGRGFVDKAERKQQIVRDPHEIHPEVPKCLYGMARNGTDQCGGNGNARRR